MAGRIALDLRQFKHICSDEHSTTLEHKDGHRLTMAHKPLSKEAREQLEALAKAKKSDEKEPEKYAEGGKVQKYAEGDYVEQLANANKPEPMMSQPEIPAGSVPESLAPEAPVNDQKPIMPEQIAAISPNPSAARFNELKQMFPNQPDEVILRTIKREQNEQAVASQEAQKIAQAKAVETAQKEKDDVQYAAEIAQQKQSLGVPLSPKDQAALQSVNQQVLDKAKELSLVQPSAAQMQPQMPQAEVPPAGPNTLEEGYRQRIAAAQDMAKAQMDQSRAEAKVLEDQIKAQNDMRMEYDSQYKALQQERQNLMDDIANTHISPEKYWTGDAQGNGGHSKLMATIGMLIAGFNPTSKPNAVIEQINKEIEMNMQAQQQNLASKQNLLAANLRQFGNLRDAQDMTRLMLNDYTQQKIALAAANARTPMAAAIAKDAIGKLKLEYAPIEQRLAASRTLQVLKNQAIQDPTKLPAYLTALDAVDPKAAKDARDRYVPGVGIANTSEGAKGVKEMGTTVGTVNDSIARLKQIAKSTGKSLSPGQRAEADTIRSTLIGQLRVPITGPGAMSEGERALLERSVPDVTSLFSLDSSNIKRLDTLAAKVNNQYKHMLQLNGLNPAVVKGANEPLVRIDRATGRKALFDPQTKKFLGYEK